MANKVKVLNTNDFIDAISYNHLRIIDELTVGQSVFIRDWKPSTLKQYLSAYKAFTGRRFEVTTTMGYNQVRRTE
jgi:hypothetical protein